MNLVNKENRTNRRRNRAFSPLFAASLASHDYDFYGESEFNAMMRTERKRTERSKKPLLLMLLDAAGIGKGRGGRTAMERIAYALCSCSRKIDIKGWYKGNEVFGVVFTELPSAEQKIKDKLTGKVMQALSRALRPDELQGIKISLHSYPEEEQDEGGARNVFDLYLYPDLSRENRTRRWSLMLKRIMDLIGSVSGLILLSPLFFAIALAVKMASAGPVLFAQRRLGLSGRQFTLLKFRSMYANSDPKDHIDYIRRYIEGHTEGSGDGKAEGDGIFKIKNDRRVTPLGRLLRQTSLDELPQLINVLKGDMSLVGPRPPIPYEYERYEIWHRRRVLEVKPGLTGLWQVKGRSITAFDEMVRLDLRYVRDRSVWLDLKILLQTPGTVFSCRGAY